MDFYLAKNATLPLLVMELTHDNDLTHLELSEMFDNCSVTFSMVDQSNKVFRVANKPGVIIPKKTQVNSGELIQYFVAYQWTAQDTQKTGDYIGEFQLNFLGDQCGKLIIPIQDTLYIHIKDSITKSDAYKA